MKHITGTRIQRRDGYVFIKTEEGLVAEHRWIASQRILGRELRKGECVIRRLPDRMDNSPENLVVVQHRLTKFVLLPHSRVIYVPKAPKRMAVAA